MGMGEVLKGSMCYEQKAHVITSVAGSSLFRPGQAGLTPSPRSVGTMGYWCTYGLSDGHLRLCQLEIRLDMVSSTSLDSGGLLLGRQPVRDRRRGHDERDWRVEALDLQVPFSGTFVMAADRLEEPQWLPGYLRFPAMEYRIVRELSFDQGRLLESHDRSERIAEVRAVLPDYDSENAMSHDDEMRIRDSIQKKLIGGLLGSYWPP